MQGLAVEGLASVCTVWRHCAIECSSVYQAVWMLCSCVHVNDVFAHIEWLIRIGLPHAPPLHKDTRVCTAGIIVIS
jgi:hypothetical protein